MTSSWDGAHAAAGRPTFARIWDQRIRRRRERHPLRAASKRQLPAYQDNRDGSHRHPSDCEHHQLKPAEALAFHTL